MLDVVPSAVVCESCHGEISSRGGVSSARDELNGVRYVCAAASRIYVNTVVVVVVVVIFTIQNSNVKFYC